MIKLLVICGPTATGKTSLAIYLAKKFGGEIVSADSRQVYKGMDIATGKDIPPDSKFEFQNSRLGGFYLINKIRVWGYDLVSPKDGFSVSRYTKIANAIIKDIIKRKNIPILVGGTGLYIKGVVDGIPTSAISQNAKLRKTLLDKKAKELFEILRVKDPIKAATLNLSDKKNARRLVRAIEIAESDVVVKKVYPKYDTLFVGLTTNKELLLKRIGLRVTRRVRNGMDKEVTYLLKEDCNWDDQSMSSIGYKQWRGYFDSSINKKEATNLWKLAEKRYAKRQLTWFGKDKRINWFDINEKNYKDNLEKLIKKWHNQNKEKNDKEN